MTGRIWHNKANTIEAGRPAKEAAMDSKAASREEIISKFHDGQTIAIGGQTSRCMPERLIGCI